MPRIGLSLTLAALFVVAVALAQGPAAPGQPMGGAPAVQPTLPVDPQLKVHLDAWEATMKQSVNFSAECTVTRKNLLRKTEKPWKGTVMCMKPNLGIMRIDPIMPPGVKPAANDYEAYICSGKAIYEYDANNKTVNEYPLPANGASGNLLLDFVSGAMTAKGALERFNMKLTKVDANYVYLELLPKLAEDKLDFQSMTIVLFGPNVPKPYVPYLPSTVITRKQNGQEEEMWQFLMPQVNVKMEAKTFEPVFPKDWKHVKQQPKPVAGAKPPGLPTTNIPPLGPPK